MVVPPIISDSTKPTTVRVAASRLTQALYRSTKMQRWRTKFGLCTLLAIILFASCFFAAVNYLRQSGIQEVSSVEHLNSAGCWILPDYQLNTVPSATQEGRYIQTRSHGSSPYETPFAWILGEKYYCYHSDVIVEQKIEISELVDNLQHLRHLEYVFYIPDTLTESDVDTIQTEFPDVNVVSALKLGNK